MSLFDKILTALGLKKAAGAPADKPALDMPGKPVLDMPGKPPAPKAIPVVDVVAKLEGLAKKNPQSLTGRSQSSICSSCWT